MIRVLHTFIATILIVSYTIVMASIAILIAPLDRSGEGRHWCARTWCKLISATVGLRVTVEGAENLVLSRPAVYLSNHQSFMDIPVLFAFLPFQFRILAKKSLFRVPFMGWFLWVAGHIAVDRGNRNATPKMMRDAKRILDSGVPIVLFPEGTRNVNPAQVKEFKAGGFKMALEMNAPIVPITIYGTFEIMPPHSVVIYPRPVHLMIGKPIEPEGSIPELVEKVSAVMNERLDYAAERDGKKLPRKKPVQLASRREQSE